MRARLLALPLLLTAAPAPAANLEWPGPAPCNTTLQACIDAADAGDRIRVGSEGPIDQDLSIVRSLRLEALPGYAPRLPPGRRISAAASGAVSLDLRLRGFLIDSGSVDVIHAGTGTLTLSLQDLDITAAPGRSGLRIDASGSGPIGLTVENVAIAIDGLAGTDARPGLALLHAGSGALDGVVGAVRLRADGLGEAPALRIAGGPGSTTLDVFGLRIDGVGLAGGIDASAGTGPLALNLVGNAVVGLGPASANAGRAALRVDAGAAATNVNLLNNTTLGTPRGVALTVSTGSLAGAVQNNLVTAHPLRGMDLPPGTVSNRNNLVAANGSDSWAPGPGTLTADPRLVDPAQPRLRADSPAIGAADRTLLDEVSAARGLPALDVDGLRRFKGTNAALDIGAFEYGDALVEHLARADNSAGAASAISAAALDGQPQQSPQLTARRAGGVAASGPLALRYTDGDAPPLPAQRWLVRDESGATLPFGAGFDLFVPDRGGAGVATLQPATQFGDAAVLDLAGLNGDALAVVFATHHRNGAGSGEVANPHPLGVEYDPPSARWRVVNLDGAPMPAGIAFTVYWQAESGSAFAHEAAAPNLAGAATALFHPLLDGNPCARPQVQAVRLDGGANPHPIGTTFDAASGRWRIENRDGAAMAAGSTFHVLVLPAQAEACAALVFADGFE
jgi:hypothetical protein